MLAEPQIRRAMSEQTIVVTPFHDDQLGPNSIDLHLGRHLLVYEERVLDCARWNPTRELVIPDEGLLLEPDTLYLGVTQEFTRTDFAVPWLDGKSSLGRLGVSVHVTAGRGDIGFAGHWTLEIEVARTRPRPWWASFWPWYREGVIVYPGMPIAQITYFPIHEPGRRYDRRGNSKYMQEGPSADPRPVPSKMHQNFPLRRQTTTAPAR